MASWPAELPQNLIVEGFSYAPQSQVIRTEMDAGPAFQRRRYTTERVQVSGAILVVGLAPAQTFLDFLNNTLNGGAEAFDWKDPIRNSPARLQFIGTDPPVIAKVGGDIYRISMHLEILP